MKAQDKLLQMPRTLSLQQCLTVCQHYESLQLHIQQIQPVSDKYIKFLKKHHPKGKKKQLRIRTKVTQSLKAIQSSSHNNPLNKNLIRENDMGVAVTFIKIGSENVQHGALLAESATNQIIGKTYVASYPQEDSHKGMSEDKTDPW